jgi:hypothetical protein
MVVGFELRDRTGGLRHPVHLDEPTPERLHCGEKRFVSDRRRAVRDCPHRRVVAIPGPGDQGQELQHRRNIESIGSLILHHQVEYNARHEFTHDDRRSTHVHADHGPTASTDMEQRHSDHVDRL